VFASRSAEIVQVSLMGVLIGIAIPTAMSSVVNQPTPALIALFAGFLLQTIIFYHGKIATLSDEDHRLVMLARPGLALVDYGLNILIVLGFVLVSLVLREPQLVVLASMTVRVADLVLVLTIRHSSFSSQVRRAQTSWAVFDVCSMVVWGGLLGLIILNPGDDWLAVLGPTYLTISVLDILMDYTYNRDLYFKSPNSWEAFATEWDKLQGDLGDDYRQHLIIPAINQFVREGYEVLDLGCGNGCISRALTRRGARVTGIDSSVEMVACATARSLSGQESFRHHDIRQSSDFGIFHVILSVFTHQDAGSVRAIAEIADHNLAVDGTLVLVYEDLDQLEMSPCHATSTRRWLDHKRRSDGSRRQLVYWQDSQQRSIAITETTLWASDHYVQFFRPLGFHVVDGPRLLTMNGRPPEMALRLYSKTPRFGLIALSRACPGEN